MYLVLPAIPCGHDQNRKADTVASPAPNDFDAIEFHQAQIDQRQVEWILPAQVTSLHAVPTAINGIACSAQHRKELITQLGFIFQQQQTNSGLSEKWNTVPWSSPSIYSIIRTSDEISGQRHRRRIQ